MLRSRQKMYYVYILLNESWTRTYTGVAVDVDKRLKEDNNGEAISSRPYRPYEVIHIEAYDSLKEARAKEQFYKTTTGRRKLKELVTKYKR